MKKMTANDHGPFSGDSLTNNLAQLKAIFPEVFAEGIIDFDTLKELLGGVVEERDEKYGLNWHGKRRARQIALTTSNATLRPCPEESVDWDSTQNMMLEGDNLEVLKLLQKSYAGKVKLIYLDPPYNTGNDFIYPDNFQDNVKNYLELTGQIESGKKITSNTESSGRFHTDWLSMMYPRLKLARSLLRDDGLVFVSISDKEAHNIRALLDDVFGEENFIAQIVVQSNKRGQTYKEISQTHEYLVVYSRSDTAHIAELAKDDDSLPYEDSKGRYDIWELRNRNPKFGRHNRPNLYFPIYVAPAAKDESGYSLVSLERNQKFSVAVLPKNSEGVEGCWRWSSSKIAGEDIASSCPVVIGKKRQDGGWNIYQKSRKSTTKAKSLWTETAVISEQGTIELGALGMANQFDHPKPLGLLRKVLSLATDEGDLVLDFFAGSGTTGHAVFLENLDGLRRRLILVQLPEPIESATHRTIADVTKERLRRAGAMLMKANPKFAGDLGFRVFKLDTSNLCAWDPDRNDLPKSLEVSVAHLKPDRTDADVVYELLLKLGLDLCTAIKKEKIAGKVVHSIGEGVLFVCLAKKITRDEVELLAQGIISWHTALAPSGDTTCVFRDSAFADDVAKTNIAAILNQHGIAAVRSL